MSFQLSQQLLRVIDALCNDVATPVSRAVLRHCEKGEWAELLKLRISPSDYTDALSYWKDSVCVDLLRKSQMDVGIDRKGAARSTFLSCEAQNCATNVRLSRYLPETLLAENPEDGAILQFIEGWRKEVADVLKALPVDLTMRFGKGSTYGDKGQLITVPDKMSAVPTITEGAQCLKPFWYETSWYSSLQAHRPWLSEPEVVRGNRFSAVPKTGLTDRGICIEPSLNISFQLDVGRLMKTRLRHIGIDLIGGQSVHQERAQASSFLDTDATIDMSNASDTMCRVLPKLVLPDLWWELLNSLRSPMTLMDGKWYRLEKFSSMGNGFTFELETVIFATLARLVVAREGGDQDRVSCYGDDLIVPKKHAKSVLWALKFFGFDPNERKTFIEGPFRESCGGDYFNGVPVRAHFLEELPHEPQQWISLANGLRRVGLSDPCNPGRFRYLRRAWQRCLDAIPSDIRRFRGPEALGDLVIHDDQDRWLLRTTKGYPEVQAWAPIPEVLQWHHWTPATQLASCTLGFPSSGITPRGGVSGYRKKWVAIHGTHFIPEVRRRGERYHSQYERLLMSLATDS